MNASHTGVPGRACRPLQFIAFAYHTEGGIRIIVDVGDMIEDVGKKKTESDVFLSLAVGFLFETVNPCVVRGETHASRGSPNPFRTINRFNSKNCITVGCFWNGGRWTPHTGRDFFPPLSSQMWAIRDVFTAFVHPYPWKAERSVHQKLVETFRTFLSSDDNQTDVRRALRIPDDIRTDWWDNWVDWVETGGIGA